MYINYIPYLHSIGIKEKEYMMSGLVERIYKLGNKKIEVKCKILNM